MTVSLYVKITGKFDKKRLKKVFLNVHTHDDSLNSWSHHKPKDFDGHFFNELDDETLVFPCHWSVNHYIDTARDILEALKDSEGDISKIVFSFG